MCHKCSINKTNINSNDDCYFSPIVTRNLLSLADI